MHTFSDLFSSRDTSEETLQRPKYAPTQAGIGELSHTYVCFLRLVPNAAL